MVYPKKIPGYTADSLCFFKLSKKAKQRNNTTHWPKNDNKLKLHDPEKYH